jgi:hypothetical protein
VLHQQAVGGGEDVVGFLPQADQRRDVEEPAVVELGVGEPPPGQPVVLGV